jgi:acyl-CoA thioesterase-1
VERRRWKVERKFSINRVLSFVVVFSIAAVFSACSKETGELRAGFEAGRYRTIVAFGDSIVEGYGQPEGWPEKLGRDLAPMYNGIQVINAGVSGDTAADGLARLRKSVLDLKPDMVLIAFGLNDMKNGRSVDAFASDLAGIVDGVLSIGAEPVLLTTTRLQKGTGMAARVDPKPFNEAIRALVRDRAISLVDVNENFKGYNTSQYLLDVAHPNGEGYRVLADIIREGLIGK